MDPQTVNIGLAVPTRGSDVGTWDIPINGDMTAIDGLLGGVANIGAAGGSMTLTVPAGFTASPGAGPVQSQNAVLKFTGSPGSDTTVTLPAPGYYIIENALANTSSARVILRAATLGQVIAVDKGLPQHVYNDGTNVRFVDLGGAIGEVTMWAGRNTIPGWVNLCSIPPYLLCDGSIYSASTYPYLFAILGGSFGGNGSTTFGVPDLRGRVPVAYDGTGGRITQTGSNLNGQSIGAAGGDQNPAAHSHPVNITSGAMNQNASHLHNDNGNFTAGNTGTSQGVGPGGNFGRNSPSNTDSANIDHVHQVTGNTATVGTGQSGNVQPSQIVGIYVIRAA